MREYQEIRLQELSRDLGLPEAELARMALDRFPQTANQPLLDHMQSLAASLQAARQIATQHRPGYHDAQIWVTAQLYQVPLILSEDFPTEATVEGVRF